MFPVLPIPVYLLFILFFYYYSINPINIKLIPGCTGRRSLSLRLTSNKLSPTRRRTHFNKKETASTRCSFIRTRRRHFRGDFPNHRLQRSRYLLPWKSDALLQLNHKKLNQRNVNEAIFIWVRNQRPKFYLVSIPFDSIDAGTQSQSSSKYTKNLRKNAIYRVYFKSH